MECQDARAHIADYLAGTLPDETLDALRSHAAACATCRAELDAAEEMWDELGRIPPAAPDVPAMQTRFDAALAEYQQERGRRPRLIALAGLAAAALLFIGIAIGRQTGTPAAPATDTQIAALRIELGEMRQTVLLSLLQQQSAIARLQGVVSTREIDQPGGDVIAALLDTLAYDENANVRLATIDALKRFMDRDLVKRRTLDALPRQTSPLVQIALIDFVVESAGVQSVPALRTLAESSDVEPSVRARATEGLRRLGARS
jgi:Putative zinc-finger/HEAT repeats